MRLFPDYVETADDRKMEVIEAEDATDFGFEDGLDSPYNNDPDELN